MDRNNEISDDLNKLLQEYTSILLSRLEISFLDVEDPHDAFHEELDEEESIQEKIEIYTRWRSRRAFHVKQELDDAVEKITNQITDVMHLAIGKSSKKKNTLWKLKWMSNYPTLITRINNEKDKTFQKMIKLYNFLWKRQEQFSINETSTLIDVGELEKIGILHKDNLGMRNHMPVVLQPLDYERLAENLNMSVSRIKAHIQEMCRTGILRHSGKKRGEHGKYYYYIGYWVESPGHEHRQPFVINDEDVVSKIVLYQPL